MKRWPFARRPRVRAIPEVLVLWVLVQVLVAGTAPAESTYRAASAEAEIELVRAVCGDLFVYAPFDAASAGAAEEELAHAFYGAYRVLCANEEEMAGALARADDPREGIRVRVLEDDRGAPRAKFPAGFRGVILALERGGVSCRVLVTTFHAHRWLVWADRAYLPGREGYGKSFDRYALAIGSYLLGVDRAAASSSAMPEPPDPKEFAVAEEDGLYAEPPPYVIEGYENYLEYLEAHREIEGVLMGGLYEFWPTPETLDRLVALAPRGELFPNKESSMFQREARKFADRGGDLSSMVELTAESLAALRPGRYFFGLDRLGRIRCGRELDRHDVAAAERRGAKLPRANHALLFPGEPVLSAGEFRIGRIEEDDTDENVLLLLNAASGHFFYSNKAAAVREDIAVEGNRYFLSLGHVVRVLRELGIPLDHVRLAKL